MTARRSNGSLKFWQIRVYIRGSEKKHMEMCKLLQGVCRAEGLPRSAIEVVDVDQQLTEVERGAILAIPMVVRLAPSPMRRVVGLISEQEKIRMSLGFAEENRTGAGP